MGRRPEHSADRPERGWRRTAVCAAAFLALTGSRDVGGWAQAAGCAGPPEATTREATLPFDIAPQPLSRTIEAYALMTGVEVVYDPPAGREPLSPGVKGRLTPRAALADLLAGTGLSARYLDDRNIVLEPMGKTGSPGATRRPSSQAPDLTLEAISVRAPMVVAANPGAELDTPFYASRVRFAVEQSLEADPTTAEGDYAGVVELWIGGRGEVSKVLFVRKTGQPRRDAAVLEVLGRMSVEPPPSGLPQPVTVAFTARRGG